MKKGIVIKRGEEISSNDGVVHIEEMTGAEMIYDNFDDRFYLVVTEVNDEVMNMVKREEWEFIPENSSIFDGIIFLLSLIEGINPFDKTVDEQIKLLGKVIHV